MPKHTQSVLASRSVADHLARGTVGFGLIGVGIALATSVSPVALLLAPFGLVVLRGCPTCWIVGLVETISAGRLESGCTEANCRRPHRSKPRVPAHRQTASAGTETNVGTDSLLQVPSANNGQRPGTPFNS